MDFRLALITDKRITLTPKEVKVILELYDMYGD